MYVGDCVVIYRKKIRYVGRIIKIVADRVAVHYYDPGMGRFLICQQSRKAVKLARQNDIDTLKEYAQAYNVKTMTQQRNCAIA